MIYASAVILGAVLLFEILVIKDSKKALYNAWKREFERELSSAEKVDENVIRELYETSQSPKSAAEYYKETKYPVKLGEGIWKEIYERNK